MRKQIITVIVPYRTDFSKLVPVITIPNNTEISVKSGKAPDFSEPVEYIVTAKDGTTREYTVIVTVAPSSEKLIKEFGFAVPKAAGIINEVEKKISVTVPHGTALNELVPVFISSDNSKVFVEAMSRKAENPKEILQTL